MESNEIVWEQFSEAIRNQLREIPLSKPSKTTKGS